jgi:PBP1b-binding outer membrane lipoprotein LpoB
MTTIKMLFAIAVAVLAFVLTGCGEKQIDCKNPQGQAAKQECAHRASTDGSRIAPTPDPKKW